MVASGAADQDHVRYWSCVLAMVVAFGGDAAEGRAVQHGDVMALLLTKRDVGAGYSLIRDFTRRPTLAERSEGMGAASRRDLAAKWVAGAQTGFLGSARVSNQSIISMADVFRTSTIASIRKAWEARYLKLGAGARLAVPRTAPGAARFLMRGRMLSSDGAKVEVLLYQWQRGKTVQSVWIIGPPGVPRVSRLIALARLQSA